MSSAGGRTLPLRLWLSLMLVVVVGLPTLTTWQLSSALPGWQQQADQARIAEIRRVLGTDAAQWRDPVWQRQAEHTLAALGVEVGLVEKRGPIHGWVFTTRGTYSLLNASGLVPLPALSARAKETAWKNGITSTMASGGTSAAFIFRELDLHATSPVGSMAVADLWLPSLPAGTPPAWLPEAAGLAVLLLTLSGVAVVLGRLVLRPLAAMNRAAESVAMGKLEMQLPSTRAREVAMVSLALESMKASLCDSVRRQGELEQERRLFISAIAHDLRTPLFTLSAYLDGLQEGLATTPQRAMHYVEVCQEQAASLERRVSELFAFSRLEYLEHAPRREPLELGALVQEVGTRWKGRAALQEITLEVDGPPAACMLVGDPGLLSCVIENLLDNALRHTLPGGRIELHWRQEGPMAILTVADTGPGIAAQDLPHIFMPLYQGDASRHGQSGGAGLGLSIARRIMQVHGGDLTACNAATGGAVFTAMIPIT